MSLHPLRKSLQTLARKFLIVGCSRNLFRSNNYVFDTYTFNLQAALVAGVTCLDSSSILKTRAGMDPRCFVPMLSCESKNGDGGESERFHEANIFLAGLYPAITEWLVCPFLGQMERCCENKASHPLPSDLYFQSGGFLI